MTTKRNRNKNNKTKKNNKVNILTEKYKSVEDIIDETKDLSVDNKLNNNMIDGFELPNTKKGKYLVKNDYYNYINELWINKVSSDESQMKFLIKLDDFRITQYKVFEKLDNIIKDYINKNKNIVAMELKNFYHSTINFNSVMSSKNYLKGLVEEIDKLREDKNNLWKMLALIGKNEMLSLFGPFYWYLSPDKKNTNEYVNYIDPHNLAVFDSSVYKDKNYSALQKHKYMEDYKAKFLKYIKTLFHTTLPSDKLLNAEDVFDVSRTMYSFMDKFDKEPDQSPDFYNKISTEDALTKYKFNLAEFFRELGYKSNNIPKFVIVSDLYYFKYCTEELLENWNSDKWRSYWIWIVSRYVTRFTDKWNNIFYEFYGKEAQGLYESIKKSQRQASILLCTVGFNALLNNEYINTEYNENNVVYATNLANNFKNILTNKLSRNKWLSKSTKDYAILKVNKIKLNIGSKKIDGNYKDILPLLNFNPHEFLENYNKVLDWRHQLYIDGNIKLIKTINTYDFNSYPFKITNLPSYVVNAQYLLYNNSINISTAYLQDPFIELNYQGIMYNLAHIGFTVAHELSHSLDDIGSQYDANGNMDNWWSNKDRLKFEKIQDEIVKQYSLFAKYDGLKYDTYNTVGEDLADMVGLSICEEYLRDLSVANKYPYLITLLRFRMFYAYFAYQMKQSITKKGIKYETVRNPHALDKYRTNVTLSRSPFFKAIYDVKKGDKMYWNNKTGIWD